MKDQWQTAPPNAALLMSIGIPPDETERWVAQINALRTECGCSLGARFLVGALVLYTGLWGWFLHSLMPLWQALLLGVVVLFFALGIGKMTGILLARSKLRRVVQQLRIRAAFVREEGASNG